MTTRTANIVRGVVGGLTITLAFGAPASGAERHAATKAHKAPTVAGVAAAPVPAKAATFEELFEEAEPVADLVKLVDPLFDTCDPSDPLEYRQCEGARGFLETEVRSKTYVAIGDAAALVASPYDASLKEVDVDVQGCLACVSPLSMSDGKGGTVKRFVTTKPPRAIKAGRAIGLDVDTLQLVMTTPERDAKWKKQEKKLASRLRTQFVFKLGATWSSGSFSGASFVPLGFRVFDACSGEVLDSKPASSQVGKDGKAAVTKIAMPAQLQPGDTLTCPAPGEDLTPEERAEKELVARLPQSLNREMIERGMATSAEKIHDCHVEFEESGTVSVRFSVEGKTGKVGDIDIAPPFDKTPGGTCIRAVVKSTRFSRFKNETQEIKLPVYLR